MPKKNPLIQNRGNRPIPRKIQRNKMRHKIRISRNPRPRLSRHLTRRGITQEMNIHNLPSERRTVALDIDKLTHILELGDCFLFMGW
jgi:hypothetical protein